MYKKKNDYLFFLISYEYFGDIKKSDKCVKMAKL